jgi:phosphoenolpyruvate carboxylase
LAKVELGIWDLYFDPQKPGHQELSKRLHEEFHKAVGFVKEISGHQHLIWYRPWLEESIGLRSPQIHMLNFLQILAMSHNDEKLLRETLVGISSGMLTTG